MESQKFVNKACFCLECRQLTDNNDEAKIKKIKELFKEIINFING